MSFGEPFYGEVVSTDASAGVAFTLYKAGSLTAYTLLATEFVTVSDFAIVRTAAGSAAIVGTSDASGSRLIKGDFSDTGGIVQRLQNEHVFAEGVVPQLIAAAGTIRAFIHGTISKA